MANASDSDSEDWRFDPSRADQEERVLLPALFLRKLVVYFIITITFRRSDPHGFDSLRNKK